jgi:ferredoxin
MSADNASAPRRWYIRLDTNRCQGHNRCYSLAPELFDVDELGQGLVRAYPVGDSAQLHEKALLAAANCPELAIEIEDMEDPAQ